LRHGNPNNLSINLDTARASSRFKVADDGKGFDPAQLDRSGSGYRACDNGYALFTRLYDFQRTR